jgi:tRNA-guanine family transglycosylase
LKNKNTRQTGNIDMSQRFGQAITPFGVINIRHKSYAENFSPIQEGCKCPCCRPTDQGGLGITKAYIHHIATKETVGAHL